MDQQPMQETTTGRPTPVMTSAPKSSLGVPIAIVLAAALIAGAIVFTGMQKGGTGSNTDTDNNQVTAEVEVAPVTEKDHIRGNPNAPIIIVEYSDFDCPFCKSFHATMNKIMDEYGKDGKVAWVFRQFPLQQLHPNAPKTAAASECVASLGGNDAFWKFTDLVYGDRTTNEPANLAKLPEYAEKSGVDKTKYNNCVSEGKFTKTITDDVADALKTGARGTPYSFLVVGDQKGVINGAQPYENVKQMIDTMIAQLEGKSTK